MFTAHLRKRRVAKLESTTNDVMTVQLQYPIEFGVAAIFLLNSTVSGTIKTNLSKFHKKFILFICFFECQAPMYSE